MPSSAGITGLSYAGHAWKGVGWKTKVGGTSRQGAFQSWRGEGVPEPTPKAKAGRTVHTYFEAKGVPRTPHVPRSIVKTLARWHIFGTSGSKDRNDTESPRDTINATKDSRTTTDHRGPHEGLRGNRMDRYRPEGTQVCMHVRMCCPSVYLC